MYIDLPDKNYDILQNTELSRDERLLYIILCYTYSTRPCKDDLSIDISRGWLCWIMKIYEWRYVKKLLENLKNNKIINVVFSNELLDDKSSFDNYNVGFHHPKANKRKTLSSQKRFSILKRDKYTCKKCGNSPSKDEKCELHVDHITPVSKDGTNDDSNLQTLCSKCNIKKGNKIEK